MNRTLMSRSEVEYMLQRRYTNQIATFTTVRNKEITGKINRISVESASGELMVIFILEHTRYECDIQYFFENIKRLTSHGNTSGRDSGSPGV